MTVELDGMVVWVTREDGKVEPGGILDFSPGKDPPLNAARGVIADWHK